jgi:hypothetical protein
MHISFRFLHTIHFSRFTLCGVLLLLFSFITKAQIIQSHRYEREQKGSDEYYNLISLKEEGLALLRERDKYDGNKRLWEVILLDTALQEKKTVEYYIEERYPLIGYEVTPQHLYMLYRTGENNRNSLRLIEINTRDGVEASRHDIKPEVDFKITHFVKVGSSLALGGYVTDEPAILLYNLNDKSIKVVPGFFQKDSELVDLRVNQNQTFNAVLIDRAMRAEQKLIFKTYDEAGKLFLEDLVPIDDDRALQTSISSTLEREELMMFGTWGSRQGKQSAGFFSLPVDPFTEQKIKYFNFGSLDHFLDYLNPKRAERVKSDTKGDTQAGRIPSFTSYVVPYKIEEHKDGYLLLAEVYNPVSTSNPYYSTPYGNPYNTNPYYYNNPFWPGYFPGMRSFRPYSYGSNVKNSDQIKTFATVLLVFDARGELMWDRSIKLDDIEKPALEQVSDYYYDGSQVTFLYKKESELKAKTTDLNSDNSTEVIEKIKLNDSMDEVRDEKESEGGLMRWVGNTFYVWGYQTIRNQGRKEDRVRDVFYINKITVR